MLALALALNLTLPPDDMTGAYVFDNYPHVMVVLTKRDKGVYASIWYENGRSDIAGVLIDIGNNRCHKCWWWIVPGWPSEIEKYRWYWSFKYFCWIVDNKLMRRIS